MISVYCLQLVKHQVQRLSTNNIYRQFQISMIYLSKDIFHVQDEIDFQKQVLDSKKPFLVDFQASW